ncbi:MAG: hypothetical protein WCL08_09640 [Verrucomicrobiota bacterium]
MSDDPKQPERVWDEYDWERFLRKQDQRTELYLELLERYSEHPERESLIANAMGWTEFELEEEALWEQGSLEMEAGELEDLEDLDEEEALARVLEEAECADDVEVHPLYQSSFELTLWLDEALEARGPAVAKHPAALELAKQVCILGGKLAAALSDLEGSELGMTLAYLKRALRAATLALNAYAELRREKAFGRIRDRQLRERLFGLRGGIVGLMGEVRGEWRRRHGK